MSGFARRCAWALLVYLSVWAFVWLLQFAGAWTGPLASAAGAVTIGVVLLPLLLFSWAVVSRPILAPFVAAALGVRLLLLAAVGVLVLLRIYNNPVLGYTPDDEFGTLFILWGRIVTILGVLVPSVVLLMGAAAHLRRYWPGRVALAVAALICICWALSPQTVPQVVSAAKLSWQQVARALSAITSTPQWPDRPDVSLCQSQPTALMGTYVAAQYNPAVGLYREAPNVAPDTYWVYSDGYLAGADVSRWNVPVLRKWTILVDKAVIDESELTYSSYETDLGNGVRSEVADPTRTLPDWDEYADRLLFAAINAQNGGNWTRASQLVARANAMWNGRGLNDKFHRSTGMYQTYHVALYYYASKDLRALEVLLSLQETNPESNRYGGMYTEYGEDGRPFAGTDTNIETTSSTLHAIGEKCFIGVSANAAHPMMNAPLLASFRSTPLFR